MNRTSPRTAVSGLITAFAGGQLTEDAFIAALVALPVVEQLPAAPEGIDSGLRADGPLRAVRLAAMGQSLTPELAARATTAMIAAGHKA